MAIRRIKHFIANELPTSSRGTGCRVLKNCPLTLLFRSRKENFITPKCSGSNKVSGTQYEEILVQK